ncbi:MAG: hypothetical protein KR126chlam6_00673 [Candidatus Anoxychlamydiales bacterium]|nr:hypothetical protein [Candidatus Anoxychlamydiales bacterium]
MNKIATVKFSLSGCQDLSISDIRYKDKEVQATTKLLAVLKKSLNTLLENSALKETKISEPFSDEDLSETFCSKYTVEILKDKSIKFLRNHNPSDVIEIKDEKYQSVAEKISTKIHLNWIFNKATKEEIKAEEPKTIANKAKNISDDIFVQKLLHAKATDIAFIGLTVFTVLAMVLTLIPPHTFGIAFFAHLEHLAKVGAHVSHPVFGILNTTVGLAILTQSIKNFQNAKKIKNKEEMIIACLSLVFSLAIITTGAIAIANLSNDIVLKTLFTICASFSLSIGSYNFIKTQMLKKQLKKHENNLQKFFEDLIQINKQEYNKLKNKTETLEKKQITKDLKNSLSIEEFEKINDKDLKKQRQKLFNIELEMLQRRKIAKLERLIRSEKTTRVLNVLKGAQDPKLYNDLKSELRKRSIAESFRIFAPILAISAFCINDFANFDSLQLKNLVYYSTMLFSKLSGFWLNYVPSWRNVAAKEKKTPIVLEKPIEA